LPTFTPPTDNIVPTVDLDERDRRRNPLGNALMRHFARGPRGRNVFLLTNNTVTEQQPANWVDANTGSTNAGEVNTLKTWYGGHSHPITDAEATILTAAGYGAYIT